MITKNPLQAIDSSSVRMAQEPSLDTLLAETQVREATPFLANRLFVQRALDLTPSCFRAHSILADMVHKSPESLPGILSALVLNLSSTDELRLRETFGILERTLQR